MLARCLSFLLCFFLTARVGYAENDANKDVNNVRSIGGFAKDLLSPVNTLGDFIGASSIILGVFCCLIGFFQYLEYRKNAYSTPMSSVFAMVIPGVLFLTLPFLPVIIGAGLVTPQS